MNQFLTELWGSGLGTLVICGLITVVVWRAYPLWCWIWRDVPSRLHYGATDDDFQQMIQEENLQLRGRVEYHRIRYAIMESCVVKLAAETLGDHYEFSSFPRVLDRYIEQTFGDILNAEDKTLLRNRIMSYIRAENRLSEE